MLSQLIALAILLPALVGAAAVCLNDFGPAIVNDKNYV